MLGKLPECKLLGQGCPLQTQRRSCRAVNGRLRAIDFTCEVNGIRQRSIAGLAVRTFIRAATQPGRAHKEHDEPTREEASRRPHDSSMADSGHLGPHRNSRPKQAHEERPAPSDPQQPPLAPPAHHPVDQPTPGPAGRVPADWERHLH